MNAERTRLLSVFRVETRTFNRTFRFRGSDSSVETSSGGSAWSLSKCDGSLAFCCKLGFA